MLTDGYVDTTIQQRLQEYPHLMKYVNHFNEHDGASEDDEYLPKLIVWFRRVLDVSGLDPDIVFGWDEPTANDFYSWGHNSRWANTFWWEVEKDLEFYVATAIELAKDYGDPEINYGE